MEQRWWSAMASFLFDAFNFMPWWSAMASFLLDAFNFMPCELHAGQDPSVYNLSLSFGTATSATASKHQHAMLPFDLQAR
jgi:hypothetical protein